MKRLTRMLILIVLVFLLLPQAFAQAEEKSAAERGLAMIQTARNWEQLVLPQEESYLDEWKTLYPRKAWQAPSLPVWYDPHPTARGTAPYVYEGTAVTVVAEENDMACMLYRAPSYKLYVGWIQSIRLLEDFPGELLISGQPLEGEFDRQANAEFSWSNAWFPGTCQLYTVLKEPVNDCVGFTFEYQLIQRNGAPPEAIFGPRRIYVHDGEKWIEVGSFPYPTLGAVRVELWLEKPVTITAIATDNDCPGKNLFTVRQTASDFLLLPKTAA